MFRECINLKAIDLDGLTSNSIATSESMFQNCSNLIEIKSPTSADSFSNSKNTRNMFFGCRTLTYLNTALFKDSDTVDAANMFAECNSIVTLDFTNTRFSSLKNASSMFEGCTMLSYLKFDKCNPVLEKADSMFAKCKYLTNLDISSLDFSNVKDFSHFVFDNNKLVCMGDLNTSSITNSTHMFEGNYSLISPNVTVQNWLKSGYKWYNPNLCLPQRAPYDVTVHSVDKPYPVAFDDNDEVVKGAFAVIKEAPGVWRVFSHLSVSHNHILSFNSFGVSPVTKIIVNNFDNVVSAKYMLLKLNILTSVEFNSLCNSNLLISTSCMFSDKNLLGPVDFTYLNTSKVVDMSGMFSFTDTIAVGDSPFNHTLDVSAVLNMKKMFANANVSKSDFSTFNSSKATDMSEMFMGATIKDDFTFSRIVMREVVTAVRMFKNSNVKTVDMTNAELLSIIEMTGMFEGCKELTTVRSHGALFTRPTLAVVDRMFKDCVNLDTVSISNFTASNLDDLSSMFANCHNLKNVNTPDGWPNNIITTDNMFSGCNSLVKLESLPTNNNLNSLNNMFKGCTNLECLNAISTIKSNGDRSEYTQGMFDGCSSLTNPDLPDQIRILNGMDWTSSTPCP
jgi:surface protein